jgi:Zn-dependent M28 family amino/carboxypeptidase
MNLGRKAAVWVPASLVLFSAGGVLAAGPTAGVSAATYEKHVAVLASDEFAGRKPGQAGERKTLDYLQAEFQRLGLKPASKAGYLQDVPMVEITANSDTALTIRSAAATRTLAYRNDMVIWTKRVVPSVEVKDSPLVFVGYGVVAPEYQWNDYAGVDMKGKTAVILVNDPGWDGDDPNLFKGLAMTYYGRWVYKYEEAMRQGAAAALIVHEERPAAYPWDTVIASNAGPKLDMDSADGNLGRVALEGWITRDAAVGLLADAGQSYDELKKAASKRGFKAVPLAATMSGGVNNAIRRGKSANVIGYLPGRKRAGEYIVYSAHWDHLGKAFGRSGDLISNGAEDNATGVAGMLAIAESFAHGRRPERSVVFVGLTLEESGLLGSAWYAANPPFPLAQTVANINIDELNFGPRTRDVIVIGSGASELDDYIAGAARIQGRYLAPDPTPEKGTYYRSDHFNFAKTGVPALYINHGIDELIGGKAAGQARRDEYVAVRYHKPGDEYRPGADLSGGAEDLQLLYAVGQKLANERGWPNWRAGNEFRATRDRSRAIH